MAIFRKIDCTMLKTADLDAAVAFYAGKLGHALLWRTETAAGFAMPETDAELVVHCELEPQTDLLVDSADDAYRTLLEAGARSIVAPFDIAIGRCAVVRDPFGNVLTFLDQTKGLLKTDAEKNVIGMEERT
ncbi:MAG TPA: VOC family protein [Rhizomicrobium sp.]|jgi:catechol 2,3-dioxygenase-like lactoylglutathione lyase family enzyme|nr:VOC family protein [Rhizomicrobium sp.]